MELWAPFGKAYFTNLDFGRISIAGEAAETS